MAGLRPGHPRLSWRYAAKTWMPATSAGMTDMRGLRESESRSHFRHHAKSPLRARIAILCRGEWGPYFQTDLSAFQRCALKCFASASTAPLSSVSTSSSSPEDWSSARLSFGPSLSSAVVVEGTPTHSIM